MVSSTIYEIIHSSPISVFEKVNLLNPLKSKLEPNLEFFLLDFERIDKEKEFGTYSRLNKLLRIFQNENYNIIKNQQNKESYLISGFDLVDEYEIIKIFIENSNLKGLKYIDLLNDKSYIYEKLNKIQEFKPKLKNACYQVIS